MTLINKLNLLSLVVLLLISTKANASNSITIETPWSPEAPPVAKVMAGYMKINNLSPKDIKIKTIKSNLFERVEIHLTEMKDGMMKMIKQDNLNIKAKDHIELKPGGLHMMLIGKLKPIQAGTVIPVTFTFDNGETVNLKLNVKVNDSHEMMHHHHH